MQAPLSRVAVQEFDHYQVSNQSLILLLAVLAGLIVGLVRAGYRKCNLQIPSLNWIGFVPVALAVQFIALQGSYGGIKFPDWIAPAGLVTSLLILSAFAWFNRKLPGFWLLGLGLALNLIVIVWNGGLMPVSTRTIHELTQDNPAASWEVGQRYADSKDMVLNEEDIRLRFLSDRFVLPDWVPYRIAFSLGDMIIGLGAFWFMCTLGGSREPAGRNNKGAVIT